MSRRDELAGWLVGRRDEADGSMSLRRRSVTTRRVVDGERSSSAWLARLGDVSGTHRLIGHGVDSYRPTAYDDTVLHTEPASRRAAASEPLKTAGEQSGCVCTLVIVWDVFEGAPVVVAANRDEAVDRPSTGPSRWEGSPGVVAPRDERASGTWIGYNDAGVFVGLSNRWSGREVAGERSRGLLVADALSEPDAGSAVRSVEAALASAEYAGFNLVVADAEAAVLVEWDGRLAVTDLDPGIHVVMNAGYDDTFHAVPERPEAAAAQAESAARVRDALRPEPDETPDAWLDRAAGVLGDHDFGVCVHGNGFGTRSSSLISLRSDGHATYRFADGPPCETPYRTVDETGTDGDGPAEGQS